MDCKSLIVIVSVFVLTTCVENDGRQIHGYRPPKGAVESAKDNTKNSLYQLENNEMANVRKDSIKSADTMPADRKPVYENILVKQISRRAKRGKGAVPPRPEPIHIYKTNNRFRPIFTYKPRYRNYMRIYPYMSHNNFNRNSYRTSGMCRNFVWGGMWLLSLVCSAVSLISRARNFMH